VDDTAAWYVSQGHRKGEGVAMLTKRDKILIVVGIAVLITAAVLLFYA
jgi:hypothetical protein